VVDTIRVGDIGLTQVRGEVGALIRLGQKLNGNGNSKFEHAFMVVNDDPLTIIEAQPGGARFAPLRYDPSKTIYLRCPDRLRDPVASAAQVYLGVPYSFLDYAALAAHRWHIPTPGLKRFVGDTGHMICSQLVDQAAADGGWRLFDDQRWPGFVTPGALWQLCFNHPWYADPRGAP
jgi:hypothetical protein